MQSTNEEEAVSRLSILFSPGFVSGLGLLLLNDFFLKPVFHSWLTGKPSDFAGLFIFPLFFVALRPRFKLPIYLVTAILFLWWKSSLARPWIDWWNHQTGISIGRVEDLTDLLALVALPWSYFYETRLPKKRVSRLAICFVCLLSIFAFTATSFSRVEQNYNDEYQFEVGQEEMVTRIERFNEIVITWREKMTVVDTERIRKLRLDNPFTCEISFHNNSGAPDSAVVVVSGFKGQSKISLRKIIGRGKVEPEEWRKYFERQFIEPLRQGITAGSSSIRSIRQL
jgi:hypothetical protein